MKNMKRVLILVCSMILLMIPAFCYGEAIEDYEEAHKIYIAAGASVAAYNDRVGNLARLYLEGEGWEIDRYIQNQGHVGARFILAKKEFSGGKQVYVLAFVGTETSNDIKFDVKVDKIYFAGNSIEDFIKNARKKGVPETEAKVHRGFHEFLQSGLMAKTIGTDGTPLLLSDILLNNKNAKLYLVGHSLGGAAATLAGAGLISMGVPPEQIEVITFGAPAVGNLAFATKFDPLLKLTRIVISGDPVTGVFQTLVGGYKQFGKEIRWTIREQGDQYHKITEYVDLALKNYYEKSELALETKIDITNPVPIQDKKGQEVYIAPMKNNLPETLSQEFWYMQKALLGEYQKKLPGSMIAKDGEEEDWKNISNSAIYRWMIVPEISGTLLKQEKNIYHITLSQTVYEVATGAVVQTASFSTGTYNLTPLEAFIHDFKGINKYQDTWLLKEN